MRRGAGERSRSRRKLVLAGPDADLAIPGAAEADDSGAGHADHILEVDIKDICPIQESISHKFWDGRPIQGLIDALERGEVAPETSAFSTSQDQAIR